MPKSTPGIQQAIQEVHCKVHSIRLLPWHLWVSWGTKEKLPCSRHTTLPHHGERLPTLLIPLSARSAAQPDPQPSLFQLPANLRNHSNKPITSSQGNQGSPHPLFYYKAHPPQLLLAHSVPECNPHMALWPAMASSGLCVWLTLPSVWAQLSRVRCLAFSYLYYLGQSSSLNNLANRASRRHSPALPQHHFLVLMIWFSTGSTHPPTQTLWFG